MNKFKIGDRVVVSKLHDSKTSNAYKYYKKEGVVTEFNTNNSDIIWISFSGARSEAIYINYISLVKDEFVLPEKWCFKVTKENYEKFKHLRSLSVDYGYISSKPFVGLDWGYFYSELPPDYTEITFEQFQKYVLKESIENTNNTKMNQYTITREQLGKIYDVACSSWKDKISKLTESKLGAFGTSTVLSESEVGEMFNAASETQLVILKAIFTEYKKDKNAFVKEFNNDVTSDFSQLLFKNRLALQITYSAADKINRQDLKGRSLYINPDHVVTLHKLPSGSTVIEITHK